MWTAMVTACLMATAEPIPAPSGAYPEILYPDCIVSVTKRIKTYDACDAHLRAYVGNLGAGLPKAFEIIQASCTQPMSRDNRET